MNGASTRVITLEGRCRGDRCGRAGAGDVMDGLRLALLTGDYEGRPHRRQVKARRCRELLPPPCGGWGSGDVAHQCATARPPPQPSPTRGKESVTDRSRTRFHSRRADRVRGETLVALPASSAPPRSPRHAASAEKWPRIDLTTLRRGSAHNFRWSRQASCTVRPEQFQH